MDAKGHQKEANWSQKGGIKSPNGVKREPNGHQKCIQKSMSKKGCKWDHCQRAIFLIKQEGNCIFSFFQGFLQKVDFMEICVLHSKYKVFWGSRGGLRPPDFEAILGPFSIKKLIKNRCKNRCRKSYEIWCQNDQKWRQHGSKNHDFLSLFAKRWLYESVSFTWEIKNPSTIHPRAIKKSSKIHARKCDAKRMEKWSKMEPKWGPKSLKNQSKNQSKNRCEKWCLLNFFR